jgi:uncharacterized paraquat-inducible protein A
METVFGRFRNRLRRRLVFIRESLWKALEGLTSQPQQVQSQRMCPFCGLITSRTKRVCLECGKPLRALQVERKDARQG